MPSRFNRFVSRVFRSLASMRLGLSLFGLVLLATILGTLVPGLWPAYQRSAVFAGLLLLAVANTAFCTVRQLPGLGRRRFTSARQAFYGWGVWLLHVSIIVIALGGWGSARYGRDAYLELTVGQTAQLPAELAGGEVVSLRLDDFQTDYHADGTVAEWRSLVSLDRPGRPSQSALIRVNHPLAFGAANLLQSSFGSRYRLELTQDGQRQAVSVDTGRPVSWTADGRLAIQLDAASPVNSPPPGAAGEVPLEVVGYTVLVDGQPAGSASARFGQSVRVRSGLSFIVQERQAVSGLALRYDPALPLVWAGFGLLSLALVGLLAGRRPEVAIVPGHPPDATPRSKL